MILTLDSYQVGWICALSVEADLAELMLDGIHDAIPSELSMDGVKTHSTGLHSTGLQVLGL